jgi:protein-S-isoprenylcysteine O-methyltransferase Ste14
MKEGSEQGRTAGLAGEHAFTDVGQLVLVAVFLVAWVLDSFVFRLTTLAAAFVPAFVRWPVGIVVVGLAAVIALRAHRRIFGGAGMPSAPVTDGVYALVRHPMYFGSWLFFLGLTLATLSLAATGVLALMLAFYLFVARHEERLLREAFGSRYREYEARTPLFFPVRLGRVLLTTAPSSRSDRRPRRRGSGRPRPTPPRPSGGTW